MQTIQILDIKKFMHLLLQTNFFQSYEFVSADIRTELSYSIDGHLHGSFYTEDEAELLQVKGRAYLPWHMIQDKIFYLIKGKKTPAYMKIVLRLDPDSLQAFLDASKSSLNSNDISGLFLNILFQENQLNVTCGISYKIFTLDKSIESEYADSIITLFKLNSITCE